MNATGNKIMLIFNELPIEPDSSVAETVCPREIESNDRIIPMIGPSVDPATHANTVNAASVFNLRVFRIAGSVASSSAIRKDLCGLAFERFIFLGG
jgi:hypothetical protein